MSKIAANLEKPYQRQRSHLQEQVAQAKTSQARAQPFADIWPALEERAREQTCTCLEEKIASMKKNMVGVKMKDLQRQKKRMRKLINISWFNTWALKVRFLNFCYRLGLLVYYSILFALAVGVVYLVLILLRWFN